MMRHQSAEVRSLLATVTRHNAIEIYERIEPLVATRILKKGRANQNRRLDQLISAAASEAFGKPTRIRPQWYFELRGLWNLTFAIGWVNTWVIYDELDGHGLVGFSRKDIPLTDWFYPLSDATLRDQPVSSVS